MPFSEHRLGRRIRAILTRAGVGTSTWLDVMAEIANWSHGLNDRLQQKLGNLYNDSRREIERTLYEDEGDD